MNIDTKKAAELLLEQDNILILTHKSPDGDTIGSGYALLRALLKLGKTARVACQDEFAQKFSYLYEDIQSLDFEPSCVVCVDVADTKLLGNDFESKYKDNILLCIDHHGSNVDYAKYTCLDAKAGANCEIIYQVIKDMNVPIDELMADAIYTGIATDTGCFRYSNTTTRTHMIAAKMIELGARSSKINCVMFESKPISLLNLEKLCIDNMNMYFNNKCAVITLTQEMYELSGSDESECDAITALARQIEGVLVGVTLKEKKDGTFKASIRTHEPVDAAEICKKMNGGGHKRAAGCELKYPLEMATKVLLDNIEEAL